MEIYMPYVCLFLEKWQFTCSKNKNLIFSKWNTIWVLIISLGREL